MHAQAFAASSEACFRDSLRIVVQPALLAYDDEEAHHSRLHSQRCRRISGSAQRIVPPQPDGPRANVCKISGAQR